MVGERMRITNDKQISEKYTGCVICGRYGYAHFGAVDAYAPDGDFFRLGIDKGVSQVLPFNSRKMSLMYTSVSKFIEFDFDKYTQQHGQNSDNDSYCVTLEYYIHGNLELTLQVILHHTISSRMPNLKTLLAHLIYLLSRITDTTDVRIEYIIEFNTRIKDVKFYKSNLVRHVVHDTSQLALCLSFETEAKELNDKERMYLCSYSKVAFRSYDFDISGYTYTGYGVYTKKAIYVCQEYDGGVRAIELTGNDGIYKKDFVEFFGISLSDLVEMGDTPYKAESNGSDW